MSNHTSALEELHTHYVEAINAAVAEDRMDLVDSLAKDYDRLVHHLEAA